TLPPGEPVAPAVRPPGGAVGRAGPGTARGGEPGGGRGGGRAGGVRRRVRREPGHAAGARLLPDGVHRPELHRRAVRAPEAAGRVAAATRRTGGRRRGGRRPRGAGRGADPDRLTPQVPRGTRI